jgi:hypothetical protein
MSGGCLDDATAARTCGLPSFAGTTSMDFALSDLRFIVAV